MKLKEISDVFTGVLTVRETDKEGNNLYKVFNLKEFENKTNNHDIMMSSKDLSHKAVKNGDLIFRLVYPNKIIYVDEKMEGMLVPSQWCVIRPYSNIIRAKVLKWYLESEDGKRKIMPNIIGTTIQKMSINSLKEIEIPVIKKQKQKNVEDLIELCERQKDISLKILENKQLLYDEIIREIIQEED